MYEMGSRYPHKKVQFWGLSGPLKSIVSDHSFFNNGMTARLPQLGVTLHFLSEKSAPAMRLFVKII